MKSEFQNLHLEDKPGEEVEPTQKSPLVLSNAVLDSLGPIEIHNRHIFNNFFVIYLMYSGLYYIFHFFNFNYLFLFLKHYFLPPVCNTLCILRVTPSRQAAAANGTNTKIGVA
jgi:hypothetical protein